MRHITSVLLLVLLSVATALHAEMSLDRMIVYFDPYKRPLQDIMVKNSAPENLYLQTEVHKVINPGRKDEERIPITDLEKIKLLATPKKAIISPHGRKTVRLVSLEIPKEIEEVYRITFRPVTGNTQAKQTSIKLVIAYQALVFIRPMHPKYNVTAEWKEKKIVFSNEGNMNAELRHGQFCTSKKEESCAPLEASNRLYAGQSWELELPDSKGYVRYGLFDGQFEKTKIFEPSVAKSLEPSVAKSFEPSVEG